MKFQDLPIYELKINESLTDESEVSYVALVDLPAIKKDFLAFREESQEFINPSNGEHKDEFIPRCISYVINEGKESEQAVAICNSLWDEHFAIDTTCPVATQDIKTNLKNRQTAIDVAHYGPLNPNLPNDEYWTAKGKQFNTTANAAKQSRCANCAFFNVSQKIKDCIAQGIGNELDPYNVINAGDLGYCEAFDFKCASQRTCDAWVVGGPIKMAAEKVSIDYDDTLSTSRGKDLAKRLISEGKIVYIISARSELTGMLQTASDLGIPKSRVYATGSNSAKVQKVKDLNITKHYDNNADVVKELGSIGSKFSLPLEFSINNEKQELFGPAMLADFPIYRRDGQLGEYNVVFNKETIYAIVQKFFEKGFDKNFNLMHDPAQKCEGVFAFQSYIVDNAEGRPAPKGYEDAKDGSWFLGVKINNPEVWAKVKAGEIKGFSVEGIFEYKKKEMSAKEIYNEIGKVLAELSEC